MNKQSHIERTASEPRDSALHTLTISSITDVNPRIRLFRLEIRPDDSLTFLPGQWVDLYPPSHTQILKPGGFTITSSPTLALSAPTVPTEPPPPPHPSPHIELAIQSSPLNPVAAYLFQPIPSLLHTQVRVRIGGSFVFPPPSLTLHQPLSPGLAAPLRKVVFVAGGMGINPLVSMLSWIGEGNGPGGDEGGSRLEVRVLYSVKDPLAAVAADIGGGAGGNSNGVSREAKRVLFLERIVELFESGRLKGGLQLFLTGAGGSSRGVNGGVGARDAVSCGGGLEVPFHKRRMAVSDVEEAVAEDREAVAVYVCGVPSMTDDFVRTLVSPAPEGFGMEERRVLFEKWW